MTTTTVQDSQGETSKVATEPEARTMDDPIPRDVVQGADQDGVDAVPSIKEQGDQEEALRLRGGCPIPCCGACACLVRLLPWNVG